MLFRRCVMDHTALVAATFEKAKLSFFAEPVIWDREVGGSSRRQPKASVVQRGEVILRHRNYSPLPLLAKLVYRSFVFRLFFKTPVMNPRPETSNTIVAGSGTSLTTASERGR